MTLTPHPRGPMAAAVQLKSTRWSISVGDLSLTPTLVRQGSYSPAGPAPVLAEIAQTLARIQHQTGGRLRAVVAAVSGVVTDDTVLELAVGGWHQTDLRAMLADLPTESTPEFTTANDATLAGLAESRRGASRRARWALHLLLASAVGGALLVGGQAIEGAQSSGGEFGHLPFGRPDRPCRCGAWGCWSHEVDGEALAELLGDPPPPDPEAYLTAALERAETGPEDPALTAALARIAANLGSGIAGMVNAFAPEVVTLGGLAPRLRRLAPQALHDAADHGLMTVRRRHTPVLLDAHFGQEGPVVGALHRGFGLATDAAGLARWTAQLTND